MKYVVKTLKILAKTLAGIVVFLWCYVMAVGIGQSISVNSDYPHENADILCYVRNSGVHTDIILPVENKSFNWSSVLPKSDYEMAGARHEFIGFGWGDRGFFMETPTWDDLEVSTALNAMFAPSESVMHAFYYEGQPQPSSMLKAVYLTNEQYMKLVKFIRDSFEEAPENPTPLEVSGDYYAEDDRFYLGKGSYFFTYTCNVWTNQALKSCGVRTPIWSPFPEAIMDELSVQP